MNGDLISREALKKEIEKAFEKANLSEYEACVCVCEIYDKQIDNAPTAVDVKGAELAYNNGYKHAKEKYKRPQGEWIYHKAVDYFLPCMECNNCHEEFLLNDLTPAYFKKVKHFCSNCGADMRKGSTE